jgi:hypothetical protein
MIDGVILSAWLSIHASEPLHRLSWYEITAVLVLDLQLSRALESLIIGRTADGCVFINSAMIPSSGQAALTISFSLCEINALV